MLSSLVWYWLSLLAEQRITQLTGMSSSDWLVFTQSQYGKWIGGGWQHDSMNSSYDWYLITISFKKIRNRIPFASSNLVTALECLQDNFGIIYVGYIYVTILLTWTILWLLALDATNEATKTCDPKGKNCQTNFAIFVPYVAVYLWVYQVIVVSKISLINLISIISSTRIFSLYWLI